jgi:CheY-like chemotaxis protein
MRKSVWVIDDDEIYQMIIKKLIARSDVFEDAEFYTNAIDVLEGLSRAQIFLPDVILLDINMPHMDGWQFLERLKQVYPDIACHTRIFIVSSSIAYSDKERAASFAEVSDFLTKPLTVKKLQELGVTLNKKNPV